MDGKWPFELKLAGKILIFVFVAFIISNIFESSIISNMNFASSNKTCEKDIKTTIEFTNSNDKLDIDIGYGQIVENQEKNVVCVIVISIIVILVFIFFAKEFGGIFKALLYAIITCSCAFACLFLLNPCEEKAYDYIYDIVNDIDSSKDIYLKTYEDSIEITYLTKEDNSYKNKSFANSISECKYVEGNNFKLTLSANNPKEITLYIPVKYNKDYSQLIEYT